MDLASAIPHNYRDLEDLEAINYKQIFFNVLVIVVMVVTQKFTSHAKHFHELANNLGHINQKLISPLAQFLVFTN